MIGGFDFITDDFYRIVLRMQSSLIIHPYMPSEKIKIFISSLSFFSVVELDMSEIDIDVSFDWMLNSYKGELKNVKGLTKPLLFLTNISASQAKELSSEIGVHFICIVKEPLNDNDFLSKSVIVYNQKTKKFTNYKNKPEDFNNFEAEIVQRFKETQNERNLRAKIQEVTTKANRIYECLALDLFITLSNEVNSLTPFEYDFIRDFIPKYFRISLDALPPYRQNSTIINSIQMIQQN